MVDLQQRKSVKCQICNRGYYIPVGDDIAFDKTDDSVVFIDHEMLEVEKIADSFDEFINCFYDDDFK